MMKGSYRRPLVYAVFFAATLSFAGCATLIPSQRSKSTARKKAPKDDGAPKVGDRALLFTLTSLEDPSQKIDLAEVIKERPAVFFIGSYT